MKSKYLIIIAALAILLLVGCTPSPEAPAEDGSGPAAVEESSPTSAPDAAEATSPPDEAADAAPAEDTPAATDQPPVTHQATPVAFAMSPLQRITDCRLGGKSLEDPTLVFDNGVCDIWDQNYFERSVTADLSEYYPQADIVTVEFGEDEDWYYSRIYLFSEGLDALSLDGVYALEIDLNLDARGDILILVANPAAGNSEGWSVSGVQVWLDSDNDIGGPRAVIPDADTTGNGYETLIFDSGQGDDPDLAWFRISQEEPGLLEFAFKKALLDGVNVFEWWAWASRDAVSTGKFDLVDFFAPDKVFAVDNTCGWIYGAGPRNLPNLCEAIIIQPTKKPSGGGVCKQPASCGDDPGEVWFGEPQCECVIFN